MTGRPRRTNPATAPEKKFCGFRVGSRALDCYLRVSDKQRLRERMKKQHTEPDGEPSGANEHRALMEALFQAERDKIERYLKSRLRLRREEARELAQEGYVRLIGLHKRRHVNWAALLWRTVCNLANNRIQQLQTWPTKPLPDDLLVEHRTPEAECVDDQARAAVLRAIECLPERLRTVVTMFREGYPTKQIARAVGISQRTCERDLARAIVEIRLIMGLEETHERR